MEKLSAIAVLFTVIVVAGCIGGGEPTTPTTSQTKPTIRQPSVTTPPKVVEDFKDAVGSSDLDKCQEIEDVRIRDICIRDIAVKKENSQDCEGIEGSQIRDMCYYKIAVNTGDSSLCDMVDAAFLKTNCMEKA